MARIVACCLALLIAAPPLGATGTKVAEPDGYWTGPINAEVPATIAGGEVIHARALSDLLARERALIIDVSNVPRRPAEMMEGAPWLPLRHAGIPGSLWIPGAGLGAIPPKIDRYFRERLRKATADNLDHLIVIYCHERCWLSWNAARRAIEYGYRRVYWFPEGIEGWRPAGFDTSVVEAEEPVDAAG